MKKGTLYVVATPIGNLQDITYRAVKILESADGIACEDTRKTGQLLRHLANRGANLSPEKQKLVSYFEQNEQKRIPEIMTALKNGLNIALVSDAGTPLISDPGFKLVRECLRGKIKVESIPGPSSVISALVSSGLPTDKFLFLGYLPKKDGNRKSLLTILHEIMSLSDKFHLTIILLEAPHRMLQLLKELKDTFGDIDIVTARELTKIYEEVRSEKISEAINHFTTTEPKGEFVVLFTLQQKYQLA